MKENVNAARKFFAWLCFSIVMAWTVKLPSGKWFGWLLSWAGLYAYAKPSSSNLGE